MSEHTPPLTLRGPEDLPALGKYVRDQRRRAGLDVAREAAPYLGVGVRLLVQLESNTRGKRGVTIGKLLQLLKGLGLEVVIRPRGTVVGHGQATSPAPTVSGSGTDPRARPSQPRQQRTKKQTKRKTARKSSTTTHGSISS